MSQISKCVRAEYIMTTQPYKEEIVIDLYGDTVIVTHKPTCQHLLTCTANKNPDNYRGVQSRPKFRIKIEVEAIN